MMLNLIEFVTIDKFHVTLNKHYRSSELQTIEHWMNHEVKPGQALKLCKFKTDTDRNLITVIHKK